jgi:hypothetical protein
MILESKHSGQILTPWMTSVGPKARIHVFPTTPSLALIKLDENLGVAVGRNVGADWALQDKAVQFLFFLDNDARIGHETILACLAAVRKADAALVGCLIKNKDETIQFAGLNFVRNMFYVDILFRCSLFKASKSFWEIDEASGGGMLINREAAEVLRARRGCLFDPKFFFYAEDQDFCLQVKRLGYRLVLARDAVIYHRISRGGVSEPLACYYSCRNRLFLAKDFLPLGYRILFHMFYPVSRLVRALVALIMGERRLASAHVIGLVDAYRGKTGRKVSPI